MKPKHFAVRSLAGWLLLAACLILAICAVDWPEDRSARYAATGREAQVEPVPVQTGSIPFNRADAALLDGLPGVGPAIAENILRERAENGPFFYPEDVIQVDGIGEKKLESMRDMLDLTEE